MGKKIRNTLGPLFLILSCPPFAMIMWYTNTQLEGSFARLFDLIDHLGFPATLFQIWAPYFFGSLKAWFMIFSFVVFELVLMQVLPGKVFLGPITAQGNVPQYKANGVAAFIVSILVFYSASSYFHLFPASIIYDELGYLLGALNILSLGLCLFFYYKGRYAPSSTDASITGNVIFDYYWGTELYPRVFNIPMKMFIGCRIGMMSWAIILLSYLAKQQELYGLSNSLLISVLLQLFYIGKFYLWETGYLSSLDMMHDRAGFYICWGFLVWVPCIYTSPSMYLVLHPIHLNFWLASTIFILGMFSISINYLADRQRQTVRATQGQCTVWGKKPIITYARYRTQTGEAKQNILLASGWWGISRHFHYLPEIAAAFFWSVPALFTHFAPYFYVCFLTILLFHRAFRDDQRCGKKYGAYWQEYCNLVPYKIIPYLL